MINELIKLATHLDGRGLTEEADYLDRVIKNAAEIEAEEHRDSMSGGDHAAVLTNGVTSEKMRSIKCHLDGSMVPFKGSYNPGSPNQGIEVRHTRAVEHYRASDKLNQEQRTEILAYLDRLKADREMTPPKYGGYTCPNYVKWLPSGVIWTGDGKAVTPGEGEWR